jgi:glucose/arabinose dehydrogenase
MKYVSIIACITTTLACTAQTSKPNLPEPYATKSVRNMSKIIGWPKDRTPKAPKGFKVERFAEDMKSPRWIYVAPNGDIFVAQANTEVKGVKKLLAPAVVGKDDAHIGKSVNTILLFRDANKDGKPELTETFLTDLNQPFGMLIIGKYFYVANTDAVWRYPYETGQTKITGEGKKILNLPAEGRHWTRNIVTNADHSKIYIAVGSASNVAEDGIDKEKRRACIIEINPDGTGEKMYASGLRNPVGMAWAPGTKTLWTAVNERDELGDDLVPDYITSVKPGGFYGWPYSYFGQHTDPRITGKDRKPDLVKKAIVPDVDLGSHTASLGLAFYTGKTFPASYHNGAFIGQHGSWNRSKFAGYKVVFVPFSNGKPSGPPQDFLTGFIANEENNEVFGRPVGIAVLPDGSLLVADDSSSILWRISPE